MKTELTFQVFAKCVLAGAQKVLDFNLDWKKGRHVSGKTLRLDSSNMNIMNTIAAVQY